jgi:hypothetical protein
MAQQLGGIPERCPSASCSMRIFEASQSGRRFVNIVRADPPSTLSGWVGDPRDLPLGSAVVTTYLIEVI